MLLIFIYIFNFGQSLYIENGGQTKIPIGILLNMLIGTKDFRGTTLIMINISSLQSLTTSNPVTWVHVSAYSDFL